MPDRPVPGIVRVLDGLAEYDAKQRILTEMERLASESGIGTPEDRQQLKDVAELFRQKWGIRRGT